MSRGLVLAVGIVLALYLMGSWRTRPWVNAGLGLWFVGLQFGWLALVIGVVLLAAAWWWRFRPPVGLIASVAVAMTLCGPLVAPAAGTIGASASSGVGAPSRPAARVPPAVSAKSLTPLFADVPPGGYPHGVYTAGNCTWWAAYNHRVPAWAGTASGGGANGDAWRWYPNAIRDGIRVSQTPSVGAVVVYRRGGAYGAVGHVAIVIGVGQGSYRISEMNYRGLGLVDERTVPWPDPEVEGFLPR